MKKYSILALALVLTAALLTGCRRPMAEPTTVPTTPATIAPTTMPSTVPETVPATSNHTEETRATDHASEPTNHTNGAEGTTATEVPNGEANARSRRVS